MSQLDKSIIDKTIEIAKSQGVNELDVIVSSHDSFSLKAEKGELAEYKKANSHSIGVRVIVDHKVGTSFSEALDDESISKVIQYAKNNAKFGKINKYEKITAKGNNIIDIDEKSNVDFSPNTDEMIDRALYLESEVLKREELATSAPYNGLSEGKVHILMGNSLGNRCEHKQKVYSCTTSALLKKGDLASMHYDYDTKRDWRDLDFSKCVDESIEVAKNLLDASQLETGQYDVVFETDVFQSIFNSFSMMLSAKSVISKTSPWRELLGQKVISDKLTFIDSPNYQGGFNSYPFDSEGFIKKDNTLVEDGVLKQFIHNSATAAQLDQENNFCASRSSKSSLGVGFSNFIIKPGTDKHQDLNTNNYVEILKAQGLHSGVRPISGDFSLGVSGRVWEEGKVVSYFKDVTVNGNFYEMLKEVSFVGDKLLASKAKTLFSPVIIFPQLSIAGK